LVLIPARDGRLIEPESYVCYRSTESIEINGILEKEPWQNAKWTRPFIDIEGDDVRPSPRFETKAKILWDNDYLYVAAYLEEPDIWGTLTGRDSVIYNDNDFEVFVKPLPRISSYVEFEFNVLNTPWDLYLDRPYYQGGQADISWDCKGLKHAVRIEGTLNWPLDVDRCWTIEIAIPWKGLGKVGVKGAPRPGDQWRMNLSRVEWERQLIGKYCDNWTWSCQSEINMHIPDFWGFVQFSDIVAGEGEEEFMEKSYVVKPWWEGFDSTKIPRPPDRSYLKKGKMRAWEEKRLKTSTAK